MKNFRERTFVFGCRCWSVFLGAVLPMFLFFFLVFRSRKCLGNFFLMSGLVFLGFFSLPLVFLPTSSPFLFLFSLFERESLGSSRAHPHTHLVLFVLVPFVVPPRLSVHPFWPCVLLLGVSLRRHSGPHAFLGFSWYSCPFSGREAARVFWSFLSVVLVFPFCCVLWLFSHQLEGADPSSYVACPWVVVPAPRPSEGPGAPSCAPVWTRA